MRTDPGHIALFIVLHLLVSMALLTAVLAVVIFSLRGRLRRYRPADLAVFERLGPLVNERNNRLMETVTFFGKHQFLIPANLVLIFYFLFIRHQDWFSIRAASISISSLLLMFVLKNLFHRKRPLRPLLNAARGLSFPSGHAIMSITFYGLLAWFVSQADWPLLLQVMLVILLILFALLIGFTRIYLRVHYASDVIAGFIIGFGWLLISLGVVAKAGLESIG